MLSLIGIPLRLSLTKQRRIRLCRFTKKVAKGVRALLLSLLLLRLLSLLVVAKDIASIGGCAEQRSCVLCSAKYYWCQVLSNMSIESTYEMKWYIHGLG